MIMPHVNCASVDRSRSSCQLRQSVSKMVTELKVDVSSSNEAGRCEPGLLQRCPPGFRGFVLGDADAMFAKGGSPPGTAPSSPTESYTDTPMVTAPCSPTGSVTKFLLKAEKGDPGSLSTCPGPSADNGSPRSSALLPFFAKMQRTGSAGQLRDRDRRPSAMMMEAIMLAMANKSVTGGAGNGPDSAPGAVGASSVCSTPTSSTSNAFLSPATALSYKGFKSDPNTPTLDIPSPLFESAESSGDDAPSGKSSVVAIPLVKIDPPPQTASEKAEASSPTPDNSGCQLTPKQSTASTPPSKSSSRSGSFTNLSLLPGLLRRNSSKEEKSAGKSVPKFLRQLSKEKTPKDPEKDREVKEKRKKTGESYVSQNSDDELYDAISSSTPLMGPERRPSTQLPSEMVLKNGEWKIASPTVVPKEKPKPAVSIVTKEEKACKHVTLNPGGGDSKPPSDPPSSSSSATSLLICRKLPTLPDFLAEKRQNPEEWDLFREKVFVFFLFICILTGLITTYVFYYNRLTQHVIGEGLHFFEDARKVEYWSPDGDQVLRGSVGKSLKNVRTEPLPCLPEGALPGDFLCMEWKHKARLHLAATQPSPGITCYGTAWEDLRPRPGPMTDCFAASGAAWYGAGDGVPYPMNTAHVSFKPFVSGVFGRTIVRRYWLTSNGVLITVPQAVPLFVSINKNEYKEGFFCLRSDTDNRYYKMNQQNRTWVNTAGVASLNYTVCVGESLGQIHDFMHSMSQPSATATRQKVPVSRSKMKPKKNQQAVQVTSTPSPIAKVVGRQRNGYLYRPSPSPEDPSKMVFNQTHLLNLTATLSKSGVNHAWVILDHQWQGRVGDFQFDLELFPNVTEMIEVLRTQGFSLGLEITPFISVNSKAFRRGLTNRLLIQDKATPLPALTQFREMKSAAVLDPTANFTQRWMIQKLKAIVDTYNITQFVLDAGRSDVLPPSGHFSVGLPNPDMRIDFLVDVFKKAQVKLLAVTPAPENLDGHCILHREMLNFSQPEQLKQVAHTVLNAVTLQVRCLMMVVEVPFVEAGKKVPNFNVKLMQRWLQFVSILPRSSFWPWLPLEWNRQLEDYRNATSITTNTNRPRNRLPAPMWTVSDEPNFHWIGDQFAMGPSDFVAPILGEQKTRDVVLPSGIWIDSVKKEAFAGPKRLSKFKLDFKDILYFTCISSDSLGDESKARYKDGRIRRKPNGKSVNSLPWS